MLQRNAVWLVAVAMLVALGCEREEIEIDEPGIGRIQLSHVLLEFDPVQAGESATREVGITNNGIATLALEDLFVEGSESFVLGEGELERVLEPGEEVTLAVTFAPSMHEEASATLHVIASDPQVDPGELPLEGLGWAPMIQLDPATWDFSDFEIGCEQELPVTIINVGSAPLELQDVTFAPTSDEFSSSHYFSPGTTLNPGEIEEITIYYMPADEFPDTGYLHVHSDDPAQPDALATQTGTAHFAAEVVDEFVQEGNDRADILWIVDNSGSMYDEQNSLAVNFSMFLDVIEVQNVDYHVAVATTDDATFQGSVPIMTPATVDVHAAFADATAVGAAGLQINEGLRSAHEAFCAPYTLPGGPNHGFLRDDAKLHVLIVSNSDDESADTVEAYVGAIQQLKDDPTDVLLHGILVLPALRFEAAVALTGGLLADLQDPSWVTDLSSIVWISPTFDDTFDLSERPVVDTIEVELNGIPQTTGWAYDSELNAVVFQPDSVPDDGDEITVRYNRLGTCEG